MNTEKLDELITWLTQAAKQAVQVELPALAKEIILVGQIENTLLAFVLFLGVAISAPLAWWLMRSSAGKVAEEFLWVTGLTLGVACFFMFFLGMSHVVAALHAFFAPRVYLLEYIADKLS